MDKLNFIISKFTLNGEITTDTLLAGLALLLSLYVTWKTRNINRLNELLIKKEERELEQENSADLSANFVTLGTSKYKLKIFNKGKATAHEININFPSGNSIISETEIQNKFPLESLERGQSVELIAYPNARQIGKLPIELVWKNTLGDKQEKIIHVTF